MKYFGVFILMLAIACDKNDSNCYYEGNNSLKDYGVSISESNINGWRESKCTFSKNVKTNSINITFDQWTDICNLFDVNIPRIQLKIGVDLLEIDSIRGPTSFKILDGGDAIADKWYLQESNNNFLKISSINSDSTEIKGSFSLSFKISEESLKDGKYDESLPDSLYFKNGTFTSKLRR